MNAKFALCAIVTIIAPLTAPAVAAAEVESQQIGIYGAARTVQTNQRASDMEDSLRPAGAVLPQETRQNFVNGAFALGYQFGGGWRGEVEYTLPKSQEYISDVAGRFRGSLNHHEVDSQRTMINGYYDLPLNETFALFGSAGLGWAKVKSSGWQGTMTRQFENKSVNNLAYSVGFGVTYSPLKKVSLDLGYRYVNLGSIESGPNNFANVRGLRDEDMKARLVNHEVYLGARYRF